MPGNGSILRRLDESGVPLLIARLVVGGLFVYMGVNKLADPIGFLKAIRQYQIVESPLLLNSMAIVLPWLEIIAGSALILGLFIRGAATMMIVMLAAFTPAIMVQTSRIMAETGTPFFQVEFDCGCGGGPVIIWKKLLENTGLFLLSFVALLSRTRRFSLDLWLARRSGTPAWCHLCGYSMGRSVAGLCERCATPPTLPSARPAQ